MRVDRHRRGLGAQHDAAVGAFALHLGGGDPARGAGAVVHQVGAVLGAPGLGQPPRGLVHRPAGRIADHDAARCAVGLRSRRGGEQGGDRHEAGHILGESSPGESVIAGSIGFVQASTCSAASLPEATNLQPPHARGAT